MYKTLDDFGGAILGWGIPTPYFYDYDENMPPLEAIARYLLEGKQTGGGANIYFRQRIEDQIAYLKTKGFDVRGIILYGYFGCSFAPADNEMIRNYFEKQDIRSFILEGTFQVGPPTGQLVTRVRAFLEMLS